jgi:hypothetical protein
MTRLGIRRLGLLPGDDLVEQLADEARAST